MIEKIPVAVDADDVAVLTAVPIMQMYNRLFEATVGDDCFYDNSDTNRWNCNDTLEISRRINSFMLSDEHMELTPDPTMLEVLDRHSSRFEFHVVTGRPDHTSEPTKLWFDHHAPGRFASITHTNFFEANAVSKAEVCMRLGARLLIDDLPHHCKVVGAVGIKALLYGDQAWNRNVTDLGENVERVADWQQVDAALTLYLRQHAS